MIFNAIKKINLVHRQFSTRKLLSISELMAVALCYLATKVKWPNTQNRTVKFKNAMPTKFIFSTFQFIFLSFKTLLFVSTKKALPCNLASKFTAFF